MILELHRYADAALPYILEMDEACTAASYSQHKLFVQIAAESAWNPDAKSSTGAEGLCQIEPATASDWGCNPNDPASAMSAMAHNMAIYEKQFGSFADALAAYNAGEGSVEHFGGVPPYAETQEYVATITQTVNNSASAWPAFYESLLTQARVSQAENPPKQSEAPNTDKPLFHLGS